MVSEKEALTLKKVKTEGFESSAVMEQIEIGLKDSAAKEKAMQVKSVFQFDVKNKDGKIQQWTLDLKGKGELTVGPAPSKADIIISVADADFVNLANGKLNGQKAFMGGKLKIKGNMMLAVKLDSVLKGLSQNSKL